MILSLPLLGKRFAAKLFANLASNAIFRKVSLLVLKIALQSHNCQHKLEKDWAICMLKFEVLKMQWLIDTDRPDGPHSFTIITWPEEYMMTA